MIVLKVAKVLAGGLPGLVERNQSSGAVVASGPLAEDGRWDLGKGCSGLRSLQMDCYLGDDKD